MCGIAGILGAPVSATLLDRMTDALAHRGPDGRGTWIAMGGAVGLGHRRLSILDLSEAAAQPMVSPCGALHLVFNGEIYNHVELRTQLGDFPFRTGSDTEVILAAYQRWGHGCVERFNGMFAFALWDAKRNELFCARDRLGVKPFFFASRSGQLLFGSEIKALLAAGLPARADERSWANHLCFGSYEDPDGSFFAGVRALPPGHRMSVRPGATPEPERYWYLPDRATARAIGESAAAEELDSLIDSAVALRMRSDVPVAVNLTGGLDSSAVAQSFFRQADPGQSIHVFTACFDDPAYDEDGHADAVIAGHTCVRHRPRLTANEVPSLAHEAMWSQEGPFGGIGTLAYHRLHREIAASGIKVVLEGQGGDELFGGYAYFRPDFLLDELATGGLKAARAVLRPLPDRRRVARQAHRLRVAPGSLYQDGSEFLAPETIAAAMRAHADTSPNYPTPFATRFANALYRDLTCTKLPRVLRMNDRLAMAFGVELRQPFLDFRAVEFAYSLPANLKISGKWGKFLLRRAMEARLPREIAWAGKRPVVTPQREWISGPLRTWIGDLIHSRSFRERGWFDPRAVEARFQRMLAEGIENGFPIWQWINVELWHRTFVDRQSPDFGLPAAIAVE